MPLILTKSRPAGSVGSRCAICGRDHTPIRLWAEPPAPHTGICEGCMEAEGFQEGPVSEEALAAGRAKHHLRPRDFSS